MQIVIEIDEEEYEHIKKDIKLMESKFIVIPSLYNIIANGTPLPEHHEDLVDKKEVYKKFYSRCLAEVATEALSEVTTIIPATKEGE